MRSNVSGASLQNQGERILETAKRLNQAVHAPEMGAGGAPQPEDLQTLQGLAQQLQADVCELATLVESSSAARPREIDSACRVLKGMGTLTEQSQLKKEGLKEGYVVTLCQPREKGFLNGLRGDLRTVLELDKPEQLQWASKSLADGKAQLEVCFWKQEETSVRAPEFVKLYTGEVSRTVQNANSTRIESVEQLIRYAERNNLPT